MSPRKIKLKYEGRCRNCGLRIPMGATAYWEPKKGVWHLDCASDTQHNPNIPTDTAFVRDTPFAFERRDTSAHARDITPRKAKRSGPLNNTHALAKAVLVISIALLVLGYAIAAWGPKYGVLESSKTCARGGKYYEHIYTSLCGHQYDVCVSYDYKCGNDYHPEKVMRYYSVYGGASVFLQLLGFVALIPGVLMFARRR